jgi:pimeloyl-ACP methyl ester carboxylesterase
LSSNKQGGCARSAQRSAGRLVRRATTLVVGAGIVLSSTASASPAPRDDARAAIAAAMALPPGSIDDFEAVKIGGIPQWISVRGTSADNPLLLFVHGGPGSPMMPESWTFQRPWEDYFTVVQWDQRGSGKTFTANGRNTDRQLSLDLMASDCDELIQYLLKKYHKRKIILVGHSWGSILALTTALRRPDLISAYVGVGQVVNMRRNEAEGYRLTLREAEREHNSKAIAELKGLAPYPDPDGTIPIAKTIQERKWDVALRGMIYAAREDNEDQRRSVSPLYDDEDLESARLGEQYSVVSLWPSASKVSFDNLKSVPFPLFIFAGKHDRTTPTDISREFFDRMKAPTKHFFLIDNAAHYVVNEAPGEVLIDLVRYVRPVAQPKERGLRPAEKR